MPERAFDLRRHPVHLGSGATAVVQPEFDGTMAWYERYGEVNGADGAEGRLVALHDFDEDWPSWEMHPHGSELVLVVSGTMTLVQELDGAHVSTELSAGQGCINPPGVWHTARATDPVTVLFVTAGMGTEHGMR